MTIRPEIIQHLSKSQALKYRAIPLRASHDELTLGVDTREFNANDQAELELLTKRVIRLEHTDSVELERLIQINYRVNKSSQNSIEASANIHDPEQFLESMINEAKEMGSSDIHIEKYEDRCRIRLRIDGKLLTKYQINSSEYPSLINRLKIKANLDISEKRLPQDGRINFRFGHERFDMRVSILPGMYGEKAVLRILSQDESRLNLDSLGMSSQQLERFKKSISSSNGIVLISGPTGSGKTTTLYAALKTLNDTSLNLCTIEDPIEYTLDGVNQVQVKEDIGLDFSSALRSFLRQDPDVIMLGEIRDKKTAQMAIRASLTGHLVLSTIHTNSAIDTISRLMDMDIPSFLITNTLRLSIAQRLVRKLCKNCKAEMKPDKSRVPDLILERLDATQLLSVPVGCPECHYTGYDGRIAIYEMLESTKELREKIRSGISLEQAIPENHHSLSDRAWKLLTTGQSSISEIYPLLITY